MAEVHFAFKSVCTDRFVRADSKWRCGRKIFASPLVHVTSSASAVIAGTVWTMIGTRPIVLWAVASESDCILHYHLKLKVQGMKYNLRHNIKEIVLGTSEITANAGHLTKSMRGRRELEHHRLRPQSDALALMSVWTSMVSVGWYPRIKDLVANSYGGVVGVQNSRPRGLVTEQAEPRRSGRWVWKDVPF
jgi:hypothetical protein